MEIIVNGETKQVESGQTIEQLLKMLRLEPRATVVERNGEIVDRADFAGQALSSGDQLELVRFVGGG